MHCTDATSDPMSGSVTPMPTSTSPVASFGSHSRFCSSVPPSSSARVRISERVSRLPAMSDAADSSSVSTIIVR